MKKTKEVTLLQSAIPLERGVAKHIEHKDNTAKTVFSGDGKVKEIHTPQGGLRRVHEVLHARHTKVGSYAGIKDEVAQLVEDCRLHLMHWPWKGTDTSSGPTPAIIMDDVLDQFKAENDERALALKEHGKIELAQDFKQRLRENCVYLGMGRSGLRKGQSNKILGDLQNQCLAYIQDGQHEKAAALIEATLYYKEDEDNKDAETEAGSGEGEMDGDSKSKSGKPTYSGKPAKPGATGIPDKLSAKLGYGLGGPGNPLTIVELPFVEEIDAAVSGYRITKSGSRLYRPALRKPVLPQRLFIKRSPVAPGGAVLFDSSGSMQVYSELLKKCCYLAPAATVAYYSGEDSPGGMGHLYVYAKDGRRSNANPAALYMHGGNGSDGKALDWLMQQESPRIFVTDREFCGSDDSFVQKVRLLKLESEDEVTVYTSFAEFVEVYDKSAHKAA